MIPFQRGGTDLPLTVRPIERRRREQACLAQTSPVPATRYLAALTGLRFVAALWVMSSHVFGQWRSSLLTEAPPMAPLPWRALLHGLNTVVGDGYLGVNVFFVLSGFILTYVYAKPDGSLRVSRREYWVTRAARIYPVYLLAALVALGPYAWYPDPRAPSVITIPLVLALAQAWFPPSVLAWNPPGWSLSVEAFFYLVFPFLLRPLARCGRRRLVELIAVAWVLGMVAPVLCMILGLYNAPGPAGVYWLRAVINNPLARLPEFVIGMAAGRLFLLEQMQTKEHARAGRRTRLQLPWADLCAIAVVALAAIGDRLPPLLLHDGLLDLVFAALIYSAARGQGLITRLAQSPSALVLGEASYAFYLLHYPLWFWLVHTVPRLPDGPGAGTWALCLAFIALAWSISIAVLRVVEQPARRAVRQRFVRTQREKARAA